MDVQTLGVVIAAVSVVIGVVNSILMSRREDRRRELMSKNQDITLETRQAQLFMNLYAHMRGKEFVEDSRELTSWEWEDFVDFRRKYGSRGDRELNTIFVSTGNFFDGIGVLVKRGLVDVNMVDELMSDWVLWYWERFGSVIKEYRAVSNPKYFEWVEYLYERIKPLAEHRHPEQEAQASF
jgi:hypothetical protein